MIGGSGLRSKVNAAATAPAPGPCHHPAKQGPVPLVDSVKKAEGDTRLFLFTDKSPSFSPADFRASHRESS